MEQKWPEIDQDYNLELVCIVNNQENGVFKLPRHKLDNLDEKMAMELLKQDPTYIKYHSAKPIIRIRYDHYPGMDCCLSVFTEQKKKDVSS